MLPWEGRAFCYFGVRELGPSRAEGAANCGCSGPGCPGAVTPSLSRTCSVSPAPPPKTVGAALRVAASTSNWGDTNAFPIAGDRNCTAS